MDEIQLPARIGLRFDEDRRAGSHRASSRPPLAHRQAFLAIEPVDAVDPGWLAVAAQKNEQPPTAETPALVGEVAQLRSQGQIRRPARAIADHLPISGNDAAGPYASGEACNYPYLGLPVISAPS